MKGIIIFIITLLFVSSQVLYSQDSLNPDDIHNFKQAKSEAGLVFTMAETGSGVGAFYAIPFGNIFHVGATLNAYFLRDSKQFDYQDPYTGYIYSINNANNVYIFDAMITLKRRLFSEDLHDSFRPFLAGGFGPVYGFNNPEDDRLANQEEWSFGGFVGAGADVSVDKKFFLSVRAQYRILPFSHRLGETSNHSMFELRFELGKRF
jgi:hypothetical protein